MKRFAQGHSLENGAELVIAGHGLGGHGLLPTSLLILSGLSLIPAFAGMWLGTAVRKRMNDQVFRKVFFVSLILLGLYIIVRAFILGEV